MKEQDNLNQQILSLVINQLQELQEEVKGLKEELKNHRADYLNHTWGIARDQVKTDDKHNKLQEEVDQVKGQLQQLTKNKPQELLDPTTIPDKINKEKGKELYNQSELQKTINFLLETEAKQLSQRVDKLEKTVVELLLLENTAIDVLSTSNERFEKIVSWGKDIEHTIKKLEEKTKELDQFADSVEQWSDYVTKGFQAVVDWARNIRFWQSNLILFLNSQGVQTGPSQNCTSHNNVFNLYGAGVYRNLNKRRNNNNNEENQ